MVRGGSIGLKYSEMPRRQFLGDSELITDVAGERSGSLILFLSPRSPRRLSEALHEKVKEHLDPGHSLPARLRNRPEGKALRFLKVFQQRDKQSVPDRLGDNDVAKADDAHAISRQLEQHVRAVRGDRTFDVHPHRFPGDIKGPGSGVLNMAQG
jgi:hypothetical protein